MKKITVLWSVIILILAVTMLSAQVDVTFRANSSTVPDTMGAASVFQVRGDTAPLTWGGDTGGNLVNVGGDYWEVTLQFPANSTIHYKLFANAAGDPNGDGWEAGSDLELAIGSSNMVLDMHYFRADGSWDAHTPPYTATPFMDVYFRANMQAYVPFDPTTQTVMVKGGTWPGAWGDLTWNGDSTLGALTMETVTVPGQFTYPVENFYSGRLRIPQDSIAAGDTIQYKFVIVDKNTLTPVVEWESIDNSMLPIHSGKSDTTIVWRWWNNQPYIGAAGEDTALVKFRAKLTNAINNNGFALGDTLLARWGYSGTAAVEEDTLTREFGPGDFYSVTDTVKKVTLGEKVNYQYYLYKGNTEYREIFFDFDDPSAGTQERRKVMVNDAWPTVTEVNDVDDNITGPRRMPLFQNTAPISQDVLVTYTCDIRPAYWQVKLNGDTITNTQGTFPTGFYWSANVENMYSDGVYINGPGNGTSGWQGWNPNDLANYMMFDDGTHGDLTPGDSIFAYQHLFSPDSSDILGQEYKFGLGAYDNEPGSAGFGLNHFANIDDATANFTIHTDFGSINPNFYTRWDFNAHVVGIDNEDVTVIKTPRLDANYPNPFNPVTTISFVVPKVQDVDLVVYDVLGRRVRTLLSGKQQSGGHKVLWNGTNDRGQVVSSGVYYYRLTTDNYEKTMRMVLMK